MPSNGWISARGEQGDRRLDPDGIHYSDNLAMSELVIRAEGAPRERRWTSILLDDTATIQQEAT